MKPFIEVNDKKIYLPQSVDPHNFEVALLEFGKDYFYLLCRKTSKRFTQVTGVLLEKVGKELIYHKSGSRYVQRTFPLDKIEIRNIKIDWNAGGSVSISHEPENEQTTASEE